jgi:electron transfer flavoprotein alpha subunit
MKYTAVLNGCANNFVSQAEEMNGFLSSNIGSAAEGNTIIFYSDSDRKAELIANSPTAFIKLVKVERYQPENFLWALKQIEHNEGTDLYVFPGDFAGNELSVRFAYRMAGSSLTAVNKIELKEGNVTCYKAVYSNHLQGKFMLNKKPCCISIEKGSADSKPAQKKQHRVISEYDMTGISRDSFIEGYEFTKEKTASGIEHAKFLLIAGRGVKKKEKVERLKVIAKEIGAEIGASRPIAMNAWLPMNRLIGVSGAMTKPELCIALGTSGAAAFFAGIEKSKYIIAVNTDEKASIIKSSDVAVVDDYESVLEELLKLIKASKLE